METILRVSAKEAPRWNGTLELASERDAARCTYCGAGPTELCVNPITKRPSRVPHMLHRKPTSEPPVLGS